MGLRRLPALLAAAVTAWCALSPALGSGTRPTPGTAAPDGTAEPPGTERWWPPGPTGTSTGTGPATTAGATSAEGTTAAAATGPRSAAPTAGVPAGAGPAPEARGRHRPGGSRRDPGRALLTAGARGLPERGGALPTGPPTAPPRPPAETPRAPARAEAGPRGATGRPPPSPGPGQPPAAPRTPAPRAAVAGPDGTPGGSRSPSAAPGALGDAAGRPAPAVFVVEDEPPAPRAALLRVPCELVLDMDFVPALGDPASRPHRRLLQRFNETISPLFVALPGFLRLEVTSIRRGSVVLEYDALFAAARVPPRGPALGALLNAALAPAGARPRLAVGSAPVLRNAALGRPLDPCAALFACRPGFDCVAGADGSARCTSVCHRGYCKNQGICTHRRDGEPACRCPVGSDFWFVGLRCDYRVTRQGLLGMAGGALLGVALLGALVAGLVVRRVRALLLEATVDRTESSYRRFCRPDDVAVQHWSQPWLASANSLDNPAFSNSEELLQLQILDNGCCSCRENLAVATSYKQHWPVRTVCQPSFHHEWDTSSSSMNDPMVDSGKASGISVSSWPTAPTQWTPFPILHQLSRQRAHKARQPRSYCEGMELAHLERSWTA